MYEGQAPATPTSFQPVEIQSAYQPVRSAQFWLQEGVDEQFKVIPSALQANETNEDFLKIIMITRKDVDSSDVSLRAHNMVVMCHCYR